MKTLLLLAVLALPSRADELTLHVFPSSFGVDWSSPASLARSAVLNHVPALFTRDGSPIGHVTVDVDCAADAKEPARRVAAGMTDADGDESARLLRGPGLGLGILFHDFKGRLEDPRRIEERLRSRAAKGTVSFVTFRLAPKTCRRLVRYFDEYEAKGYGAHYGLPNRPLHREGAGCSAFGASFVETAGLLSPELSAAWSKTVAVPLRYVGGPITGGRVALWKLLFSNGTHWARDGEPSKSVFFYDPDTIHAWINAKAAAREPGYEVKSEGKVTGIVYDATKSPAPAGSIWQAP